MQKHERNRKCQILVESIDMEMKYFSNVVKLYLSCNHILRSLEFYHHRIQFRYLFHSIEYI